MTAQIKSLIPKILLLAGVLALSACGGGSGGSTPSSSPSNGSLNNTVLQGQVTDGYLEKAVVFLDLNGNKVLDPGEPQTTTGADGRYNLQVAAADADQYPVVAQIVPGQTVDEDTGAVLNSPLTLEAPIGQAQIISPLTTLAKNAMDKTPGLTPDQATFQVRAAFGLSALVPLSSDYVAAQQSSNSQQATAATRLHNTAQAIAAIMTKLETDIAANLGGAIPAESAAAAQALLTDLVMSNATQITTALQPTSTDPTVSVQAATNQVLTSIDTSTLNSSKLTLYQKRLKQKHAVWDVTPPQITVQSPAAGQPAPVDTTVKVTFDEALDPASISADALTLAAPGHSVDGVVSYDDASRTLTFTPASSLAADTAYTVTVSAGLADSTGNARQQPASWSFTTIADIAPPAPPSF
jgi:hypothetical protein